MTDEQKGAAAERMAQCPQTLMLWPGEPFSGAHGLRLIPSYTLTDDFDKDFGVDEWHGHNAFIRNAGGGAARSL
jgi:hypothetical protein